MNDPESCPICFMPLDPALESYSLVHWNPATGANDLVQRFCVEHRPLPAPEWLKRETNRDKPPREIGLVGQYTGLQDKDGKPIHIGQVIRMDRIEKADGGYAFGRVWYMAPELCARRVDATTGALLDGSYTLVDWGYGERVADFTLIEGHPGATWPPRDEGASE